jgi:hypothetical protein
LPLLLILYRPHHLSHHPHRPSASTSRGSLIIAKDSTRVIVPPNSTSNATFKCYILLLVDSYAFEDQHQRARHLLDASPSVSLQGTGPPFTTSYQRIRIGQSARSFCEISDSETRAWSTQVRAHLTGIKATRHTGHEQVPLGLHIIMVRTIRERLKYLDTND